MLLMGFSGLGDYIDATDPCTINPSDPICVATQSTVQSDPCAINPNASYCQSAINAVSSTIPYPDASSWNNFVSPSTAQPGWAQNLIDQFKNFLSTPTLNPTPGVQQSGIAASLSGIPWKPVLLLLVIGGGALGYVKYRERKSRKS